MAETINFPRISVTSLSTDNANIPRVWNNLQVYLIKKKEHKTCTFKNRWIFLSILEENIINTELV